MANEINIDLGDSYVGSSYSPQVEVTEIEGGHELSITSKKAGEGIITQTFDVMDGEKGERGERGLGGIAFDVTPVVIPIKLDADGLVAEEVRIDLPYGARMGDTALPCLVSITNSPGDWANVINPSPGLLTARTNPGERPPANPRAVGLNLTVMPTQDHGAAEIDFDTFITWQFVRDGEKGDTGDTGPQGPKGDSAELEPGSVGTIELADGAVTTPKLGDGAVTTAKIDDWAVTEDKLSDALLETIDSKADADGYYEQMAVGMADNLTPRGDATLGELIYRTSGGNRDIDDGTARVESIHGKTIVFNQLIRPKEETVTDNSATITFEAAGTVRISGSCPATAGDFSGAYFEVENVRGHKYLVRSNTRQANLCIRVEDTYQSSDPPAEYIFESDSDSETLRYSIYHYGVTSIPSGASLKPQAFDLTRMFGAGNEPSTVAEFVSLYNGHYGYDTGTVTHVNVDGLRSTGFNLLDGDRHTEVRSDGGGITVPLELSEDQIGINYQNVLLPSRITRLGHDGNTYTVTTSNTSYNYGIGLPVRVIPGMSYHFRQANPELVYIVYYDGSGRWLNSPGYSIGVGFNSVAPAGAAWAMIILVPRLANRQVTFEDIGLNIRWTGYRDGEYEEPWHSLVSIPVSDYFSSGMRSAGNVYDELRRDRAITRVGAVDLGALTWQLVEISSQSGSTKLFTSSGLWRLAAPPASDSAAADIFCAAYTTLPYSLSSAGPCVVQGYAGISLERVTPGSVTYATIAVFDDTYATVDEFKAAMDGVILYYEMAEESKVPIDPPLNLNYRVSDFGTEEVTTPNGAMTAPVPMEIAYGINATDTIRRLPKEYISRDSFANFCNALSSKLGITITETWSDAAGHYTYQIV